MVDLKEIGANILLFCLVFGMSATVDTGKGFLFFIIFIPA